MAPFEPDHTVLQRTVPGQEPEHGEIDLDEPLARMLDEMGIERLYRHQADAITAVRDDRNVVVSTPTASGKSMIYTLPAVERALDGGRTLYIAPMTALINDQTQAVRSAATAAGLPPSTVQKYTGQLDRSTREQVRSARPRILLATVDMLHMSVLPYARRSTWDWLLESLDLIVIDELHEFRGVFGSQVALVFRRLQRLLDHVDRSPPMVACSATIGNPEEHARNVTGREDWTSIEEDTSSSGARDWHIVDNEDSPHPVSLRLATDAVMEHRQTLVFTQARQTAERYALRMQQRLRDQGYDGRAEAVDPYHAALTSRERDRLEERLQSDEAEAVWSTTALELGIDVGSLDTVIIDGYPGSRMQLHQQAGRAGRGTESSDVVLVPGKDRLDQHLRSSPEQVFGAVEDARVNPANTEIVSRHLGMAARELPLREDEPRLPALEAARERALDDDRLRETDDGYRAGPEASGKPFGLRQIGEQSIALVDSVAGERITELNYSDAITDAYPDAVYLHQGDAYEVTEFDREESVAWMRPATDRDYYTQPMKDKQVSIEERIHTAEGDGLEVTLAEVQVDGSVEGYYRKRKSDHSTIADHHYQDDRKLPFSFRTEAIVFILEEAPETSELADGLHAAEHAGIGVIPLHVLCDRRSDLGGLSVAIHPETRKPTIVIHEGHPGGVDLLRAIYPDLETILAEARQGIEDCDCADGCESCIFSPTCGNANNHLDKQDGIAVLRQLEDALPDIEPGSV